MEGTVAVALEELKAQVRVYQLVSDQMNQAINKVNSTNQQRAQQWKGQAFQSYLDQYQQLEGNVKKMEELLTDVNQQLNKYADTASQRDQQDAQSFGF